MEAFYSLRLSCKIADISNYAINGNNKTAETKNKPHIFSLFFLKIRIFAVSCNR